MFLQDSEGQTDMAANSNPALCTHPNAPTSRVIEGGWSTRELGGYAGTGGITQTLGDVVKVAKDCPDCSWELEQILVNPDEITKAATPTAGSVSGTSPTAQVTLDWPDAAEVDSYKIQRSTDGGATYAAGTPATATSSTSTQTALSTGSVRFRIISVKDGVDSAPSSHVSVTVS